MQGRPETPRPQPLARILVAGFIHVEQVLVGQAGQEIGIGRLHAALTFCTSFASCPRLIGTSITSRKNLRIVENDMWQAPLRKPTSAVNCGPHKPAFSERDAERMIEYFPASRAMLGNLAVLLDRHQLGANSICCRIFGGSLASCNRPPQQGQAS